MVGKGHIFNSNVLGPQYQRNADGSYTNVGANPAVDVFDGEKWLRSCGAVTNLVPSQLADVRNWTIRGAATVVKNEDGSFRCTLGNTGDDIYFYMQPDPTTACTLSIFAKYVSGDNYIYFAHSRGQVANFGGVFTLDTSASEFTRFDISSFNPESKRIGGISLRCFTTGQTCTIDIKFPQLTATPYPVPYTPPGTTMPASNATVTNGCWFTLADGSPVWKALDGAPGELFSDIQVSNAYFDTSSTQEELIPNANTRTTEWLSCEGLTAVTIDHTDVYATCNRCRIQTKNASGTITYLASSPGNVESSTGKFKFYIPSGAVLFRVYFTNVSGDVAELPIQRIQPQPLTLATRVRMGVGSGDLPSSSTLSIVSCLDVDSISTARIDSVGNAVVHRSYDGATDINRTGAWPRNSIIRRVTQVNTAGTHFRIGYMIEGTNTAIQWSSWQVYDGSFDPSTLYRLMLGYNNPYPMWFNKIAVWKKQATDAEILEALS